MSAHHLSFEKKTLSLNPNQQEAVLYADSPLLVLAGAGSGKTRVLTQRMIHLIREQGVSPWHIFAVTFTNKAAKEMKERVMQDLGAVARDLWISTFHSSCLRILRRHAEALGFTSQFAIYDTSDQISVIKQVINEMELNDKFYKPKMVLSHIDRAKNAGQTPDQFTTHDDYFLSKVQEIYTKYQEKLRTNQAMDFGDLILNVIQLFKKRPDILGEYQQQFRHIMIDEYQDTNAVQYLLIKMLADLHQNIFVVGDDDQSIYKFRGAEIQNILNFQKDYPNARVIRLEQNYRSTQNILTASNAIIAKNKERMGKKLWTQNEAGEQILIYNGETEKDEARFVTDQILKLKNQFSLSDIAVFYRTNAQSRSFEDEFRRNGLPYKIFGGMKFYDRAEIKDTLAYLRLLTNRSDSVSLKRILNVPARGIGKTTIEKIEQTANDHGITFWDVLKTAEHPHIALKVNLGTLKKLKSFVALIEKIDQTRAELSLEEFITYLYEQTGYWKMLTDEKSIEAESRKENLNEFVNVVEEFCEVNPETRLEDFLDQVSLASDVDKLDENAAYITLMTIHLSKGLEYPVVFLVGLEEGLFPHARSLENEDEMEEERRLCYVGMTRAQKRLFMCYANERRIFGSSKYNFPSRFLEDLPQDVIEKQGIKARRFAMDEFNQDHSSSYSQPWSSPSRKPLSHQRAVATSQTYTDYSFSQEERTVQRGMRVKHSVFGEGTIQNLEGCGDQLKVVVKFHSGVQKKLLFKHAHLQVM